MHGGRGRTSEFVGFSSFVLRDDRPGEPVVGQPADRHESGNEPPVSSMGLCRSVVRQQRSHTSLNHAGSD